MYVTLTKNGFMRFHVKILSAEEGRYLYETCKSVGEDKCQFSSKERYTNTVESLERYMKENSGLKISCRDVG